MSMMYRTVSVLNSKIDCKDLERERRIYREYNVLTLEMRAHHGVCVCVCFVLFI